MNNYIHHPGAATVPRTCTCKASPLCGDQDDQSVWVWPWAGRKGVAQPVPQAQRYGIHWVCQSKHDLTTKARVFNGNRTCSGVGRTPLSSLKKFSEHISWSNCCMRRAISSGSIFFTRCISISGKEYLSGISRIFWHSKDSPTRFFVCGSRTLFNSACLCRAFPGGRELSTRITK